MNKFLESYLSNIVPVSFIIRCEEEESIIGEGTPEFTVKLHKIPEKKDMLASTSLALGEAYIKGDLELDRDLYVVLDDTLSYSCGYFANATDTLYEAQVNKVDHILEKLYLKADMKLLDIGCGWGYLLMIEWLA